MLEAPFAFARWPGGNVFGSSSTDDDHTLDDRPDPYGPTFLASHRALAACSREVARLSDRIVRGVTALPAPMASEKATVRRSPDRCIVQLGPVALTVAWLRSSHESVAAGELLVIVWRGIVAPPQQHQPERPGLGSPLAATAVWEEVLVPVAESEESWAWQPRGDGIARCSSTELASRCLGRLSAAYVERAVAPVVGHPGSAPLSS